MQRTRFGAVLASTAAIAMVAVALVVSGSSRTALEFANANEYLDGYVWEAPYDGAGPPTPVWDRTPTSVGQGGETVNNPEHQEHNVLGNDYQYPDYANTRRFTGLAQISPRANLRGVAVPNGKLYARSPMGVARGTRLWVGSPQKFLPIDGDYPGGQTGIPMDGYLAYETGWANDGPFHGETAPLQEAGIAKSPAVQTLASIMDPGYKPHPFNDWALGNSQAVLDRTYDPAMWEQEDPPLDAANLGKVVCIQGMDCHDDTYQGGMHDNGNQMYDNYPLGSIDRNSDRSVGARV